MAKYEVSPDLINQVQILLRKESGLPSFNPSDHPPPSPSVLQDAIAAVGSTTEDVLRCHGCNGELLRGSESIICVFCGSFPRKLQDCPSPPPPISFISTFGFHWFLRALSLDGSENIERQIEGGSESGRAPSLVKNEIPLSALLDLQLNWPDESNRFGVDNEPGKQPTTLVGLNFEELLRTEGNRDGPPSSSYEPVVVSKNIGNKEDNSFAGQSSLSLFENPQTGLAESENDESDWAAEFQSANADAKVDSGFDMDSIHGRFPVEESAKVAISQAPSTSAIESMFEPDFDFQQSERNVVVKDGEQGLGNVDASFDWLPAPNKQKINDEGVLPHDIKLDGGGGSFDNWDEFGTFSGAESNRGEPISASVRGIEVDGGFGISDSWNDFAGSSGVGQNNSDVNRPVHGEGGEFALWGHAGVKQNDVHLENMLNKPNNQVESLGLWSGTSNEVDDSFDLWNDFKSSDVGHTNQRELDVDEAAGGKVSAAGDGAFKFQNDKAGLSHGDKEQDVIRSEAVGDSLAAWNDNSLDVWSDFARSTGVLDSKSGSNETSSGALSDLSSLMFTHANPPQSSATKSAGNQTAMQDDDDFGSWSGFSSSLKQPDRSFSELKLYGSSQDKISPGPEKQAMAVDNHPQNSWDDFGWSTSNLEHQSHVGAKPSGSKLTSEDHDLFPGFYGSEEHSIGLADNQIKSNGSAVHDSKSASGNDELIDAWGDFTSSSKDQANNWHSNVNATVLEETVKHDPFKEWDVIGSASNNEAGNNTAMGNKKFPQLNLSNADADSQLFGSNSFLHQDSFLGMVNNQNGTAQEPSSQTKVPNSARSENGDFKAGEFDHLNGSETALKETLEQQTPVVENLISEMHDLSFMLESSLSIPRTGT